MLPISIGPLAVVPLLALGPAVSANARQPAPADTVLALTLEEVLARVRSANLDLKAARWAVQAAESRVGASDVLPDPMVSAVGLAGAGRMARFEVMAEQDFPWPGILAARRRSARLEALSELVGAGTLAADLELDAAVTYLEAASVDERLVHLDHFVEELLGFERAASARYEVGTGPQQAILRVQLEKNAVLERAGLLLIRRSDLMERLARIAGGAPPDWRLRPLVFPAEGPLGIGPADDPSVDEQAAVVGIDAADVRVEMARLGFRPSLSARVVWIEGSIMRGRKDAVGVGGALSIPLWRDGPTARLEEAKASRARAEAELESVRLRIATERAAALARIDQGRRLVELLDGTLIPQAEATQEAASTAYSIGRADYLDLLDAERMLLELRLSRVDRLLNLHRDAAVARRLGGASPTDSDPIP